MKIYQLHEYNSEWEIFTDYIIGSYLRKERAEEEKAKAELEEKELIEYGKRCSECPFIEEGYNDLESLLIEHYDYCDKAKLINGDYGIDCKNYYSHWEERTFEIKEVEVEE